MKRVSRGLRTEPNEKHPSSPPMLNIAIICPETHGMRMCLTWNISWIRGRIYEDVACVRGTKKSGLFA
jgi:hypothetical protein